MSRRWRRILIRWLLILVVLYTGIVIVFSFLENRLVFQPATAAEWWADPGDPRVQDVWLDANGVKIHGWFRPADSGPEAGAVLVSHGNGGNLSHRAHLMFDLHRHLGRSVLLYDYPGYGKSGGRPSEAGCYASGEAAFQWLTKTRGFPEKRIVLLGESLGGGPATELATRHDAEVLVLAYTFTSLPAVAKRFHPWLPCETLMSNRFDNLAKIPRVKLPIFIAHGTADEVIPYAHGEALYAAANEPKQFHPMPGFTHNLMLGEDFYQALGEFLREIP